MGITSRQYGENVMRSPQSGGNQFGDVIWMEDWGGEHKTDGQQINLRRDFWVLNSLEN